VPEYPLQLTGQDDADQAPIVAEPGEQAGRIIGGSGANDLGNRLRTLAELPLDDTARPRVVIDDPQDRSSWHGRHP
jgi:hypothetical protein